VGSAETRAHTVEADLRGTRAAAAAGAAGSPEGGHGRDGHRQRRSLDGGQGFWRGSETPELRKEAGGRLAG